MIRKLMAAATLVAGVAIVTGSPAFAGGASGGWSFSGPHGATASANFNGSGNGGRWGGCCFGGGVAAGAVGGLAVGTALGVAAASHPVYAAPPPVVYAPPAPVVVSPGAVVYVPYR
jgi:hypothetical protein